MIRFTKLHFLSFLIFTLLLLPLSLISQNLNNGSDIKRIGRCNGISPYPGYIDFNQSDGTSVKIKQTGTSAIKRAITADGYTVLQGENADLYYADKNVYGDLICSNQLAHNQEERTRSENEYLKKISKNLDYSLSRKKQLISTSPFNKSNDRDRDPGSLPSVGNHTLPVIFANFSDTDTVFAANQLQNMFIQTGYGGSGKPCVSEYFSYHSDSLLNLNFYFTSWINLPQTHDYYGNSSNYAQFAYDAIVQADPYINFAQFDNNNDGVVEAVNIIHQGAGEEASYNTNDIWSHMQCLEDAGYSQGQRMFDGVEVNCYTVDGADDGLGNMNQVGIICHEIGHLLGAPDFYDTDPNPPHYQGTGFWDLQADGFWNGWLNGLYGSDPAAPNAFTQIYYYDWYDAVELNSPITVSIMPTELFHQTYYYTTTTPGEYFLIENRENFGGNLPGDGLLIYHVDENYIDSHFSNNNINTAAHQGLKIIDAGNNGNINTDSCPFPGSGLNYSFTDASTPASLSWSGNPTNKPLTNISYVNMWISFNFMGGSGCVPPPLQCSNLTASNITDNSISINWDRGMGEQVLVFARKGSPISVDPTPAYPYIADQNFGVGESPEPDAYTVFNADGNMVDIHNLDPGTTYHFALYEAFSTNHCYRLPPLTGSFTTTGNPIGIEDNLSKIYVYPRITENKINIEYPEELNDSEISVFSITGKRMKSQRISSSINLESLASGTYVIEIKTASKTISERIVKL